MMLKRYKENGLMRRRLIANDFGKDVDDLPLHGLVLNGVPADSPSMPSDIDYIKGWKENGKKVKSFADYSIFFNGDGTHEGQTIILSISGYDGLFTEPKAILQAVGHWKDGILAILTEQRVSTGMGNFQSTGSHLTVYIEIPAFCHWLRVKMATDRIPLLERQKEVCVYKEEIDMLKSQIETERKKIAAAPALTEQQKVLFATVCEEMAKEKEYRKYARVERNVAGAGAQRQTFQGEEDMPEESFEDFDAEMDRYATF